jgi:hypothetical protein
MSSQNNNDQIRQAYGTYASIAKMLCISPCQLPRPQSPGVSIYMHGSQSLLPSCMPSRICHYVYCLARTRTTGNILFIIMHCILAHGGHSLYSCITSLCPNLLLVLVFLSTYYVPFDMRLLDLYHVLINSKLFF